MVWYSQCCNHRNTFKLYLLSIIFCCCSDLVPIRHIVHIIMSHISLLFVLCVVCCFYLGPFRVPWQFLGEDYKAILATSSKWGHQSFVFTSKCLMTKQLRAPYLHCFYYSLMIDTWLGWGITRWRCFLGMNGYTELHCTTYI